MAGHSNRRRLAALVYVALLAFIAWQAFRAVVHLRTPRALAYSHYYTVTVSGNVDRPGKYRVPEGTTQLEILRVAGVRLTSDILSLSLAQQVDKNDVIAVGALAAPVALAVPRSVAKVEFFTGNVSVNSADNRYTEAREGLAIADGDQVLTQAESQAEVSIGSYTRIDIDAYAELLFEKVNAAEQEQTVTRLEQRSGVCWYKVVYGTKEEQFRVNSGAASLVVGGSGAEFVVEVESDLSRIHVTDGLLLAERSGGEAINVIAGQTVTAYMDDRPFQVTRLAMDVSPTERFAGLTKEKTTYLMKNMPLNILFCGIPRIYYFCGIRFDKTAVDIVNIPGETIVQQFAQGMTMLDQALLFGGPTYAGTVIEQLLSVRITNFIVLTRDDVVRIGTVLGGIAVPVDERAAAVLGLKRGEQKLDGEQLMKFMSPTISGVPDSRRRQMTVLKAFFDKMRTKNLVLTAMVADQIMSSVQTNMTSGDLMEAYGRFGSGGEWQFRSHSLPGRTNLVNGQTLFEADLDLARKLLSTEG